MVLAARGAPEVDVHGQSAELLTCEGGMGDYDFARLAAQS
jgi:hypothetical protein